MKPRPPVLTRGPPLRGSSCSAETNVPWLSRRGGLDYERASWSRDSEHRPITALRAQIADLFEEARQATAAMIATAYPKLEERGVRAAASLLIAILDGLALQWIVDPERTPTGAELGLIRLGPYASIGP